MWLFEASLEFRISSLGLRDLSPVTTGLALLPLGELMEDARWTVITDEDEADAGRGCRWCKVGCARLDAMSKSSQGLVLRATRAQWLQSRDLEEPGLVSKQPLRASMRSKMSKLGTVHQVLVRFRPLTTVPSNLPMSPSQY